MTGFGTVPGYGDPLFNSASNISVDEMMDSMTADIVKRFESGLTGQGETHERSWPQDPVLDVIGGDQDHFFKIMNVRPSKKPYPLRLRQHIPDQFETDFLDCQGCRSLSTQGWQDQKQVPKDSHTLDREEGYYILFPKDLKQTRQTCPICYVLLELWLTVGKNSDLDPPRLARYAKVRPGFGGNGNIEYHGDWEANGGGRWARLCYAKEGTTWLGLSLDIRSSVRPRLDAKDAADTVREWLAKCLGNHLDCASADTGDPLQFPARLLDIGTKTSDPSRVVTMQPEQAVKYVALSYCWGTTQFIKLDSATMETLRHGVNRHDFPKTWQDAIDITFELGLRYVWIDALCILQDSPDDWASESSKMGQIYQKAFIVISADKAVESNAGFLDGMFDVPPPSRTVDLPLELRPDQPDLTLTVCKQTEGGFKDRIHDMFWASDRGSPGNAEEGEGEGERKNPTFQRGWCLQERYLATRIVHFTSSEMIWECRQRTCCECGFSPRAQVPRKRYFHRYQQGSERRTARDSAIQHSDPWWELLGEYTSRKLSFASDRLTAFSGVAKSLQDTEKGQYLAGIWRGRMPQDLVWSTYNSRKPDMYVAPSWSWASIIGSINTVGGGHRVPCAEVINAACDPVGTDQFGQVKGGFLVVRAPVIHAQLTQKRSRRRRLSRSPVDGEEGHEESESGSAFEDADGNDGQPVFYVELESLPDGVVMDRGYPCIDREVPPDYQGQSVVLVPLMQAHEYYYADKEDELRLAWALLLVASQQWPESYERIGIVSGCKVAKEILAERQEITIR